LGTEFMNIQREELKAEAKTKRKADKFFKGQR
jgi:hypothetical protein